MLPNFLWKIAFLPREFHEFLAKIYTYFSSDIVQKLGKCSIKMAQVYICMKLKFLSQFCNLEMELRSFLWGTAICNIQSLSIVPSDNLKVNVFSVNKF